MSNEAKNMSEYQMAIAEALAEAKSVVTDVTRPPAEQVAAANPLIEILSWLPPEVQGVVLKLEPDPSNSAQATIDMNFPDRDDIAVNPPYYPEELRTNTDSHGSLRRNLILQSEPTISGTLFNGRAALEVTPQIGSVSTKIPFDLIRAIELDLAGSVPLSDAYIPGFGFQRIDRRSAED